VTPEEWLAEHRLGKPGSARRLVNELRSALCSIFAAPGGRLEAIERIEKALDSLDLNFADRLREGFYELKKDRDTPMGTDLRRCHCKTYIFLRSKHPFAMTKQSHRALTVRFYCTVKETGSEPRLPLTDYPPKVQKKIDQRIKAFTTPKWSKIEEDIGIRGDLEVPEAKRGRKRKN
jgi:hypothetical protein